MDKTLVAIDNLRATLREVAAVNPPVPDSALDRLLREAERALDEAATHVRNAQTEAEQLSQAQGEAVVNAAMMMTELEEAQRALESQILERERAEARIRELNQTLEAQVEELGETNLALRREVDQRMEAEASARRAALHDSLTGLPNRQLLLDRIEQCAKRATRESSYQFAVLFLDIDNFKLINDSLGHKVGDELLMAVSRRLASCLRAPDTVSRVAGTTARLGGDEFVLLLDRITSSSDTIHAATRVLQQFAEPFAVGSQSLSIGASIGIAMNEPSVNSADELLRNADIAMYRAKQAGRGRYAVFSTTMHTEVTQRISLENDLRTAFAQHDLRLAFQPIVTLTNGRIRSFEALLRWTHPQRGPIGPDEFVPVAEEMGLIVDIGRWILVEACRQARAWNENAAEDERIAVNVNVSKRQLVHPGFVADVDRLLRDAAVRPGDIHIEVTESVVIEASEIVTTAMHDLKALGVLLFMDDFGTGYSSLSCLQSFPLDGLKIDRSFLVETMSRREDSAVLDAIVSLARVLNMKVVAEGIETDDQLARVLALDCDYGQGFHFSRPVDAAHAAELLTADPPWVESSIRRRVAG